MAATPAEDTAAGLATAWNHGDAEAWGERFWPDARFVNVLAHVFSGRREIVAQHARIFATIYKGSQLTITGVRTQAAGADHMLAEVESAGTGMHALPPGLVLVDGALRSHMVLLLERRGSEWKIAYAQNTAFTPLPPAPPPAR